MSYEVINEELKIAKCSITDLTIGQQIKLRHIQTSLIVQFALMSIRTRFLM